MSALALLLAFSTVIFAGVLLVKQSDQQVRDRDRKTYQLAFPSDLDADRVAAWLRSISGTLRTGPTRLFGTPTIVFELWATNRGITHRLKVPWQHADFIVAQLRSLVPGIRVTPEDEWPTRTWTRAIEARLTNTSRQLRIHSATDMAASLLASVQALGEKETILMQWVVSPAVPTPPPVYQKAKTHQLRVQNLWNGTLASQDEVNDRRDKLSEPNLLAVLRIAAQANTAERADHLLYRVKASLAAARGPTTRFARRLVSGKTLQSRLDHASGPVNFPIQLSAPELSALIAWPIGNPMITGLPRPMSKQFPPHGAVPREGIVIGHSSFPGAERRLAIGYTEALMHTSVTGLTGCLHPDTPIFDPVDRSTLTVKQRFEAGVPFHVFSMHGSKLVVAEAEPPVEYRRVGMYRLYNDDHQVVVTGQHRVWNGRAFVEVERLYQQRQASVLDLPAISDADLSRLLEDAQRSIGTHASSRADCRTCCRLCGRLLRSVSDSGQAAAPSPAGALAPCCDGCDTDDRAHTPAHSRACPVHGHHATTRSSHQTSHGHGTARPPLGDTCLSPSESRPSASGSAARSDQTCIAGCTHQFVAESTGSVAGRAGAQRPPTDMRVLSRLSTHQSRPEFVSGCNHDAPTQRQLSLSPVIEPYEDVLFNEYFKNTTFRVEQAGAETYYDLHVPKYENYLACGLIHHNTGKSALLSHMARQVMEAGHGLIVLETAGDLYESVLNYVPASRVNDVILLDVGDRERPVGFNLLDQGDRDSAIDEVMALLQHQFGHDTSGVWSQEYLYHGFKTISEQPDLSLIDVVPLLNPQTGEEVEWADSIVRNIREPELKRWWQRHDNRDKRSQQQRADPVLSRVWPLMSRPEIRYVLGQSKSAFQLSDVLMNNKILLVNLKGTSPSSAALVGSLLLNTIWGMVKRVPKTQPTFLMIDEYADTLNLPVDTHTMLAQARKHKVGLILATQFMGQLPRDMKEAVISNARNKIAFQSNADDARALAGAIAGGLDVFDVTNLPAYEAIAQVMTPEGVSGAMSLHTYAPTKGTGVAETIKQRSRHTYGTPLNEVKAQMDQRHQAAATNPSRQRPRIGGVDLPDVS